MSPFVNVLCPHYQNTKRNVYVSIMLRIEHIPCRYWMVHLANKKKKRGQTCARILFLQFCLFVVLSFVLFEVNICSSHQSLTTRRTRAGRTTRTTKRINPRTTTQTAKTVKVRFIPVTNFQMQRTDFL